MPTCAATGASQLDGIQIKLIASDVDGTLVNSKQQLTPGVEAAVQRAHAAGVPLIVATGKARGPWVPKVLPRLGPPMPGVFLQGLLICDAEGRTLYSRCLEEDVLLACIRLARGAGITLTAYTDDRIMADALDEQTERLLFYQEPTPEAVGNLEGIVGKRDVQKVIFMAPQEQIDQLRPEVAAALEGRATLTTALKGMLEVLPLGASKGEGVRWLLDHMGRDARHLMALGDGENDIEMLQLAALGVAMGNAGPGLRAVADVITGTNDEDGVAQAIEQHVLAPRRLAAM
ncbi:hypothetical protein MNEG_4483 [Monoraphidium neglectum]|uniref:Uncharacterized protein n=1 Tax=Monoraphidium neglectum TaxID=145388 RepID=A0A0D2L9G4_9CHLO|nr:hypothetical protein MNEG_4483 [Monoraphidium neglectum]KIZ03474.1 hypothetical protein MNEG_4483 [Monoraphidium neglectum]|eukprot:XP_013902493.1 hypothetical protein MNEG_4483 [Monoraphidium neglectum]